MQRGDRFIVYILGCSEDSRKLFLVTLGGFVSQWLIDLVIAELPLFFPLQFPRRSS